MPELAEVEVARRNLERWWSGRPATQVMVYDPRLLVGTTAEEVSRALGKPLDRIERRGKYLIAHFPGDEHLVFHFRMTGKIIRADVPQQKFTRLAWLIPDTGWLLFKDQRCLGTVEYIGPGELAAYSPLSSMGPEPYDLDGANLRALLPPNRQLKAALMDQNVIAGIGNIAISELFWRVRIAPLARVKDLTQTQFDALAEELPRYFDEVIATSMADEIIYLEERGGENIFECYGREGEPCKRCATPIERITTGGRSSYFCPSCQPST
jgi:formamidopyrimidine-DNA glycosylase